MEKRFKKDEEIPESHRLESNRYSEHTFQKAKDLPKSKSLKNDRYSDSNADLKEEDLPQCHRLPSSRYWGEIDSESTLQRRPS